MSLSNRFGKFLDKTREGEEKRCWFCNKTEEDIKGDYYKYMMKSEVEFDDVPLDELIIMTDKLQKPVCAGCYFNIKDSVELIEEIFNKPEDEVW
ncbi:MAG TPA: hypothetical protein VI749_08830 [Candidatus Omnitrophota bacterium]|nr:hypothetical protein [Candidatus Omnitrophota bacterium]